MVYVNAKLTAAIIRNIAYCGKKIAYINIYVNNKRRRAYLGMFAATKGLFMAELGYL
jgi:hypothetical protein